MLEDPLRRGVAEFVGAFTLIFIGAGSIVTAKAIGDPSLIGVALAHRLALTGFV
jgi:glycerol uptake facilitator-like aquaporin